MDKAIIIDLDGTVVYNDGHRPFYGPEADNKYKDDQPIEEVITMLYSYITDHDITPIFLTGRSETVIGRRETEKWIETYITEGLDYLLFMRDPNDYRSGDITKAEIYNDRIKPYFNILFALDDDPKIVEMWRKLKVTVLQVWSNRYR